MWLGWAALGYLLTLAPVSLPYDRALTALAALAAGLYYWFGAPGIAEGLGLADIVGAFAPRQVAGVR